MGRRLNELCNDIGNADFFSENYLTYISTHMKFIREHATTSVMEIDEQLVHKNMNDFYGLFMDMGVRYEDHQLLMLINGFSDPMDLTAEVKTIVVPSGGLIDRLKLMYRTVTA
jgi:hypothetical protein